MFEILTDKLEQIFKNLRKRGKLNEADVDQALREVRLAMLEADVHYGVVKDFISRIRPRAVGTEVSKALNPGQQIIKIVNEELVGMLGESAPIDLAGEKPHSIMLLGLQGSGKTTTAVKLAYHLRSRGERVLLVAADPYRPAAVKQLQILAENIDIPVFTEAGVQPELVALHAKERASKGGFSVIIIDTAGRSQLDDAMVDELRKIDQAVIPKETLLVVDAMIGQEALSIAEGFRKGIPITGFIMTKMDGDSRGGAAISIRSVTGIPIKFLGIGEKLDALERFQPQRLASRILGMGDILGLIEKAESAFSEQQTRHQVSRLSTGEFSFEDMLAILKSSKKMGPLSQLLEMLPGEMGKAARKVDSQEIDLSLRFTEAIIYSMTYQERRNPDVLDASRRRRIAMGSGLEVQDVNRLMKKFRDMQKIIKALEKTGGRGLNKIFG